MPTNLITLSQAIDLTTQYRGDKETILATGYKSAGILPMCETFARSAFDTLLAQSGCESVRAYFGMDSSLKVSVLFVGVDSDGADIVGDGKSEEDTSVIVEEGFRCPTTCPPSSVLNQD